MKQPSPSEVTPPPTAVPPLTRVLEVLRRGSERDERVYNAASTDNRVTGDTYVRLEPHAVAEYHVITDHAEWADADAAAEPRTWLDHRCRVNVLSDQRCVQGRRCC